VNNTPDLRRADLLPADPDTRRALDMWLNTEELWVLNEYSTQDDSRSWYCCFDTTATWGIPGSPQLLALLVERDQVNQRIRIEHAQHDLEAFAHNWLVERGCPPETLTTYAIPTPFAMTDEQSLRATEKIRTADGDRYTPLNSYTDDDPDHAESWVMVEDTQAATLPVRLFVQTWGPEPDTVLREGAFDDQDAAYAWLDERPGELPAPPEERMPGSSPRSRAALSRTAEGPAATVSSAGDAPFTPLSAAPGRRRAR
jgi:hypothetical protein